MISGPPRRPAAQQKNSVAGGKGRPAHPRDRLVAPDFEKGRAAPGVADEQMAVGKHRQSREPADVGLRNVVAAHRPDHAPRRVDLHQPLLPADHGAAAVRAHERKRPEIERIFAQERTVRGVLPHGAGRLLGHEKMAVLQLARVAHATVPRRVLHPDFPHRPALGVVVTVETEEHVAVREPPHVARHLRRILPVDGTVGRIAQNLASPLRGVKQPRERVRSSGRACAKHPRAQRRSAHRAPPSRPAFHKVS